MDSNDSVRKSVENAYTRAVNGQGGCCDGGVPKGVLARTAGYSAAEMASLPDDAVSSSFGCGNPLAMVEVRPGQTVLDLGSGAGIDLLLAARRVGPDGRVIGVDMTDEMIGRARRNVEEAGLDNVEVRKGIIEDLPLEDGSVDWVISNCVINLSPEKDKVFAEIHRVLRPGGQMLVSDIVARDLPRYVTDNEALHCSCIAGAIDEELYLEGLRRAGMARVEVRERLVYDADQLVALAGSEVSGGCCGSAGGDSFFADVARQLAGKLWSAKVYAQKA